MSNIVRYVHHGQVVSVREDLKGKHREHCLCYQCANFNYDPERITPGEFGMTGKGKQCPIAQDTYMNCVKHGLVTPVFECPKFKIA